MNAEELKKKLKKIFGKQVIFNKQFDIYAQTIKNLDDNLLGWCQRLKDREIKAIFPPKAKDCVVFVRRIGSSNRCIVIKTVNDKFKEIHLGDHDYYDRLRKILGLKKRSK